MTMDEYVMALVEIDALLSEATDPVTAGTLKRIADTLESQAAQIEALREAVAPLAVLKVPDKPQGNAGAYSIRHEDIERARQALAGTQDTGYVLVRRDTHAVTADFIAAHSVRQGDHYLVREFRALLNAAQEKSNG